MNIRFGIVECDHDIVWKALAHVIPRVGNDLLDGARGAYITLVGRAESLIEFKKMSMQALSELGFDVIELDDLMCVEDPSVLSDLSHELFELVSESKRSSGIKFGAVHTYDEIDDAN